MRKLIRKTTLSLGAVAALLLTFGSSQPASAQNEPYLGQMMLVGFSFCPTDYWTEAKGQILQISQWNALFSLFGTTYGGDGQTTFRLPDLRGRYPMGEGTGPGLTGRMQGARGGAEEWTEPWSHNHQATNIVTLHATSFFGNTDAPSDRVVLANSRGTDIYGDGPASSKLRSDSITVATTVDASGPSPEPDNNIPPFLVMRWCVATTGVYPPRN